MSKSKTVRVSRYPRNLVQGSCTAVRFCKLFKRRRHRKPLAWLGFWRAWEFVLLRLQTAWGELKMSTSLQWDASFVRFLQTPNYLYSFFTVWMRFDLEPEGQSSKVSIWAFRRIAIRKCTFWTSTASSSSLRTCAESPLRRCCRSMCNVCHYPHPTSPHVLTKQVNAGKDQFRKKRTELHSLRVALKKTSKVP